MVKLRGRSDAGHGGKDSGAIGHGFKEKNIALEIDKEFCRGLGLNGIDMSRTRNRDISLALAARNNKNVDFFVSHHTNYYKNSAANGIEVLYNSNVKGSKALAESVLKWLLRTQLFKANRGVKVRNDLAVLKNKHHPSVLIEYGFISNKVESKIVNDNTKKLAIASANGVLDYFGKIKPSQPKPSMPTKKGMPVMTKPSVTMQQMQDWSIKNKATDLFVSLIPLFYELSVERGVNPALTLAQAGIETGYGRFGGVINATYHNTCGLKTTKGGHDKDPKAHMKFKDWKEGITAHVDHICLYAAAPGYPKTNTPDPRHFDFIKGKGKTVEELGQAWATTGYGDSLVKLIKEIQSMPVKKDNLLKISFLGQIREIKGFVKNGVSYMSLNNSNVPVREVFESLGLEVGWDNKLKMVVIK